MEEEIINPFPIDLDNLMNDVKNNPKLKKDREKAKEEKGKITKVNKYINLDKNPKESSIFIEAFSKCGFENAVPRIKRAIIEKIPDSFDYCYKNYKLGTKLYPTSSTGLDILNPIVIICDDCGFETPFTYVIVENDCMYFKSIKPNSFLDPRDSIMDWLQENYTHGRNIILSKTINIIGDTVNNYMSILNSKDPNKDRDYLEKRYKNLLQAHETDNIITDIYEEGKTIEIIPTKYKSNMVICKEVGSNEAGTVVNLSYSSLLECNFSSIPLGIAKNYTKFEIK